MTDNDIVERFANISRRDDCFDHMVPSDVRLMLREIIRLRAENYRLRAAYNEAKDAYVEICSRLAG